MRKVLFYLGQPDSPAERLEECPICMSYYPLLNTSACCKTRVCTECFLQVRGILRGRGTRVCIECFLQVRGISRGRGVLGTPGEGEVRMRSGGDGGLNLKEISTAGREWEGKSVLRMAGHRGDDGM